MDGKGARGLHLSLGTWMLKKAKSLSSMTPLPCSWVNSVSHQQSNYKDMKVGSGTCTEEWALTEVRGAYDRVGRGECAQNAVALAQFPVAVIDTVTKGD